MTPYRVQRIIDAELKRTTVGQAGTAEADSGQDGIITFTEGIPQGLGATQRIGDWIKPINLHGTLSVKGNPEAGQITQVRCYIFRWNEDALSGGPILDDIVNNPTAPGGQFNFISKGLFKVYYTKVFNIVNDSTNPAIQKQLKIYVKLNRTPKVIYNAAQPKKNHIYFGIFSDTNLAAGIPTFRLDMTLRYTDS